MYDTRKAFMHQNPIHLRKRYTVGVFSEGQYTNL